MECSWETLADLLFSDTNGVQIIPQVGVDSTPSDLLAFSLVSFLRENQSVYTKDIICAANVRYSTAPLFMVATASLTHFKPHWPEWWYYNDDIHAHLHPWSYRAPEADISIRHFSSRANTHLPDPFPNKVLRHPHRSRSRYSDLRDPPRLQHVHCAPQQRP